MKIKVRINPEVDIDPIMPPVLRRVLRRLLLEHLGSLPSNGGPVAIDVSLVDASRMRMLNHQYRGRDEPTDVLAFPQLGGEEPPATGFEGEDGSIGDVVICIPVAVESARDRGISLLHEVAFLACHGALHLLGWTHETEEDLEDMHATCFATLDVIIPMDPGIDDQ